MKETYLQGVTVAATALAQSFDSARVIFNTYFDRNYGAGAANEITAADLEGTGMTLAQLTNFITLCEQIQRFRDGLAVTSGDYDSTLNALRRDV
jgi:hypothetical protein